MIHKIIEIIAYIIMGLCVLIPVFGFLNMVFRKSFWKSSGTRMYIDKKTNRIILEDIDSGKKWIDSSKWL